MKPTPKGDLRRGAQVVACLGGPWHACTVTRAYDDGTYDVVPVGEDEDSDLDTWQSLTRPEISVDDEGLWQREVFDRLRGESRGIGWREAARALTRLGREVEEGSFREYWATNCSRMFGVAPKANAETMGLDREQAYRFFAWAGYSAMELGDPSKDPSRDLFKLYWNSIRMGGRDPAEIGRAIGIDDALEALGLATAEENAEARIAIERFETKSGVTLPASVKALWSRAGAPKALRDAHPNNPDPIAPAAWALVKRERETGWDGAFAVRLLDPHQGDHGWWAMFESGAEDGAVWVSFEAGGRPVKRVARSVAFFFWDLCATRRNWER